MSLPSVAVFLTVNSGITQIRHYSALGLIFPYAMYLPLEDAEYFTDTLSVGDDNGVHSSFASTFDTDTHKVLWLSKASLDLILKEHDGFDYNIVIEDVDTEETI